MKRSVEIRRTPLKRQSDKAVTFRCSKCGRSVTRRRVGGGVCRPCLQKDAAAARTYERRGETRTCDHCGSEFYARPEEVRRGRKYCSRACMGEATKKVRSCSVCGTEFVSMYKRKTCSSGCSRSAIRASKTGPKNAAYRSGITERRRVWKAARELACRVCGSGRGLHSHHVVYEQHVRRRDGDVYDPDNSLTVCRRCHMAHHAGNRLPTSCFRPENLAFAKRLLGEYAADYFARYYDDGHPVMDLIRA